MNLNAVRGPHQYVLHSAYIGQKSIKKKKKISRPLLQPSFILHLYACLETRGICSCRVETTQALMPRTRKRQTQLTFAPVASSSPPGSEHSPEASPDRLARVRYGRPSKPFLRRGAPRIDDYLTHAENLSARSPATAKGSADERESFVKRENSSQASATGVESKLLVSS